MTIYKGNTSGNAYEQGDGLKRPGRLVHGGRVYRFVKCRDRYECFIQHKGRRRLLTLPASRGGYEYKPRRGGVYGYSIA